jgi:hypothetical protein
MPRSRKLRPRSPRNESPARFTPLTGWLAWSLAFAQQQSGIEVLHVRGNVYMFASDEGNITVQVGEHRDNDGVLMVDTGPRQ